MDDTCGCEIDLMHSNLVGLSVEARAANSVDFCIEFKFSLFYEFEFDIFIIASSSHVKIYLVLSSSENKVIDLAQSFSSFFYSRTTYSFFTTPRTK